MQMSSVVTPAGARTSAGAVLTYGLQCRGVVSSLSLRNRAHIAPAGAVLTLGLACLQRGGILSRPLN